MQKTWQKVLLITLATAAVVGAIATVTFLIISNNDEPVPIPDSSSNYDREMIKKPIIYLYPEQETTISIQLGHPEKLTTTYPKYNDGWQVLAEPSGNLTDLRTGRALYALYWEGSNYPARVHDTGFVVKGEDAATFLEEKLALLGLTTREANEFIIYWLPHLEHNPYNYIYFSTPEEIATYMPLSITPTPDTTIRIMMEFKPLEESITIPEQPLTTPARTGFTVVEWGGTQIK